MTWRIPKLAHFYDWGHSTFLIKTGFNSCCSVFSNSPVDGFAKETMEERRKSCSDRDHYIFPKDLHIETLHFFKSQHMIF